MTVDTQTIDSELSVFGDRKQKLVELTLIDADRLKGEIQQAFADNDIAAATFSAHSLKSIMKQVGALSVYSVAEEIECLGKAGDMEKCMKLWDELHTNYTAAREYLATYIN